MPTESAIRARAKRQGYVVRKSRAGLSSKNFGGLMLLDERNCVVIGSDFDASLEDIADFLAN